MNFARSSLHAAEEKVAALMKQLPESMQNCTILFKECPRGHGELTAANWVQHPCSTCERDALRDIANEVLCRVEQSNKVSIGSIDNTYTPQISVQWVTERREQWRALAAAKMEKGL